MTVSPLKVSFCRSGLIVLLYAVLPPFAHCGLTARLPTTDTVRWAGSHHDLSSRVYPGGELPTHHGHTVLSLLWLKGYAWS